jgi:hypothetical protein
MFWKIVRWGGTLLVIILLALYLILANDNNQSVQTPSSDQTSTFYK